MRYFETARTVTQERTASRRSRGLITWLGATLAVAGVTIATPVVANADAVTDWNAITDSVSTNFRDYTMVHAAIHDSLNAIDRRYAPWGVDTTAVAGASPEAAIGAAARRVLLSSPTVSTVPARVALVESQYAAYMAAIPDGPAKTDGIALGDSVGAQVVTLRSTDGSTAVVPYTFRTNPGDYRATPGGPPFPVNTNLGLQTPFVLTSSLARFDPGPPPELTSRRYTRDFLEVALVGGSVSAVRTPEQTTVARFWAEPTARIANRYLRTIVNTYGGDLWQNARTMALAELANYDGGISCFGAKYRYNRWRPVTAIQLADIDGNADTVADPTWLPAITTPPFPEYTSAHCVTVAAFNTVLRRTLHRHDFTFTNTSTATPGVVRTYNSLREIEDEVVNARVWGGIHFRWSDTVGIRQGRRIARAVSRSALQRRRTDCDDDDDDDDRDDD